MVVADLMGTTYGEQIGAIEQHDFACQVALDAEFCAKRSWVDEVNLGWTSELGSQQTGDIAPEADPGQATNMVVNNHRPFPG